MAVVLPQLLEQSLLHVPMPREQIQAEGSCRSSGVMALEDKSVDLVADLSVRQRFPVTSGAQQCVQEGMVLPCLGIVRMILQQLAALLDDGVCELMETLDALDLLLVATGPEPPEKEEGQEMWPHETSGQDVGKAVGIKKKHYFQSYTSLGSLLTLSLPAPPWNRHPFAPPLEHPWLFP